MSCKNINTDSPDICWVQGDSTSLDIEVKETDENGVETPINISNKYLVMYLKKNIEDNIMDAVFTKDFNLPNDPDTQDGKYTMTFTITETESIPVNNYYVVAKLQDLEIAPTERTTIGPKILEVRYG